MNNRITVHWFHGLLIRLARTTTVSFLSRVQWQLTPQEHWSTSICSLICAMWLSSAPSCWAGPARAAARRARARFWSQACSISLSGACEGQAGNVRETERLWHREGLTESEGQKERTWTWFMAAGDWGHAEAEGEREGALPGRALLALGCVVSRQGWRDSSDRWRWSRPHLPGPRTKAIRPRPPGYCPGFLWALPASWPHFPHLSS